MCSIGRTRRGTRDITVRENLFVLRGEGIDVKTNMQQSSKFVNVGEHNTQSKHLQDQHIIA